MDIDFSFLWTWIIDIADWFLEVVKEFFAAFWKIITDVICWVFDKGLELVRYIIESLDVTALPSLKSSTAQLGGEVLNMLGLIGLAPALAIIVTALGIRFALQLIPFTRLGS